MLVGAKLAVWMCAGLLLVQVLKESWAGHQHQSDAGHFDAAFQAITALDDLNGGQEIRAGEPALHGISQSTYNSWRLSQQLPIQSILLISPAEIRTIYQAVWEQGHCGSYTPPLDLVCLDSIIGFGIQGSRRFFVDLPPDPKAAALEVTQRREAFRYQTTAGYGRIPAARRLLAAGIQRDRALASLIASYPSSQPDLNFDLRRWLGLDQPPTPPTQPGSEEAVQPSASPPALTPDAIYDRAKPFTVEVWIKSSGSLAPAAGIVLTADGLILTNHHVISSSFNFVRLATGQDLQGTVVDTNPELDLALIQLEGASGLPTAQFAESSSHVRVGDTVYAIGSPTGTHWHMTTSDVIQVQSDCGLDRLKCIRTPQGFLKPGNSGGPLLDRYGQVVGINRAIQQRTGEGVSIPVETIRQYTTTYTARAQ